MRKNRVEVGVGIRSIVLNMLEMTLRIQTEVPSNPQAIWIQSSRKGSELEL